jgi:G:T/U-mismatch repair DNA glycosylase
MNFEFSRCISIILKYYYKNIIQNSFWNITEVIVLKPDPELEPGQVEKKRNEKLGVTRLTRLT